MFCVGGFGVSYCCNQMRFALVLDGWLRALGGGGGTYPFGCREEEVEGGGALIGSWIRNPVSSPRFWGVEPQGIGFEEGEGVQGEKLERFCIFLGGGGGGGIGGWVGGLDGGEQGGWMRCWTLMGGWVGGLAYREG